MVILFDYYNSLYPPLLLILPFIAASTKERGFFDFSRDFNPNPSLEPTTSHQKPSSFSSSRGLKNRIELDGFLEGGGLFPEVGDPASFLH